MCYEAAYTQNVGALMILLPNTYDFLVLPSQWKGLVLSFSSFNQYTEPSNAAIETEDKRVTRFF